jgi:phage/plasmid-like protein (TIGR03299 family)
MAHNITIRENMKAEFAFLGNRNKIWHGLGQQIEENSGLDIWRVEAGMDWQVESSPVIYRIGDSDIDFFEDKKVLYRSDNKKALSVVSTKFKVVQPETIINFFSDLIDMNGMKMSAAGTLDEGRKFWATAETGDSFNINGDESKAFTLLVTSVDGTISTLARLCAERTICNNTLNVALSEKGNVFRTSHRSEFDPSQVKIDMGLISESFYKYQQTIQKLTEVEVNKNYARKFFYELVAKPDVSVEDQPYTVDKITTELMNKFYHGIGNKGQTAFDVLNAVTEYATHSGNERTFSKKFDSSFFGKNAQLGVKAFSKLEEEFA